MISSSCYEQRVFFLPLAARLKSFVVTLLVYTLTSFHKNNGISDTTKARKWTLYKLTSSRGLASSVEDRSLRNFLVYASSGDSGSILASGFFQMPLHNLQYLTLNFRNTYAAIKKPIECQKLKKNLLITQPLCKRDIARINWSYGWRHIHTLLRNSTKTNSATYRNSTSLQV